jgi:hypothetical protein
MKTEKLNMLAGKAMVEYLANLAKPVELNVMTKMADIKYQGLRELLRDPCRMGDRVLAQMITNADDLGIKRNTFSMVYEGFWDLYWKKPGTSDIKPKALENWLNHIKLT